MRVLHVVRSDSFAGVEQHIVRLARAQERAGHDVAVIGGDPARMRAELAGTSVRTRGATTVGELARTLDRRTVDVDVVNCHMTAAELGATLAQVRHVHRMPPVVSTRHFAARRGRGPSAGVVSWLAAVPVRAQIAISEYVAAAVEGSSTVVLSGVDDAPDAPPAHERERTVLMVQRLEAEKRTSFGLQAFVGSGLAADGWTLVVVGDGAQRGALEAEAARTAPAGAVRFLGRRSDVPALMASAAVMLAPSVGEHLGLSVLEALAAGLPVVADGSGGHLETLAGLSPHALYATGDLAAATHALRSLVDDTAAREAYASAAQDRQRTRFTIERQQRVTEDVYGCVL